MLGVVFIAMVFPVLKPENVDYKSLAEVWELG